MLQIENTEAPFTATLFGEFQVWVNGQCITTQLGRKESLLLALLLLRQDEPTDRDKLAGNLWTAPPEKVKEADKRKRILQNFRDGLSRCRAALAEESSRIPSANDKRGLLQIDLAGADVDIVCFDNAVRSGKPEDFRQAYDLYKGPLLQEFFLEENIASESRLTDVKDAIKREIRQARSRYAKSFSDLCQQLAQQAKREDYTTAAAFLRRGIAAFPLNESACYELMDIEGARNNTAEVISIYNSLVSALRNNGLEPAPETKALYDRLYGARKPVVSDRPVSRTSIGRVPSPRTGLVGRQEARDEICSLIRSKNRRLVTLKGSAGIGKTRLAIAVAEKMGLDFADDYPDRIWFVELASVTDEEGLFKKIAASLGLKQVQGQSDEEQLREHLQGRKLLLVLDNCEHLLSPVKNFIDDLLDPPDFRDVAFLVTSRTRLNVEGERVYRVPALLIPPQSLIDANGKNQRSQLMEYAAVQLLDELAAMKEIERPRGPHDMLQETVAMAEICARLDGIPLALVLAAARYDSAYDFRKINALLSSRFTLLENGVSKLPHHKKLRASIEWSYKLLTQKQQTLMQRLTVFAGGWTVEAAAAVVADQTAADGESGSETSQIAPADVPDLLSSLADHSLVEEAEYTSERRYRFLQSIREFAEEELARSEEAGKEDTNKWRARHLDWFLQLVEGMRETLNQPDPYPAAELELLEQDHDNLIAALTLSNDRRETECSLRMANALYAYWHLRGCCTEGRYWLNLALQQNTAQVSEIKIKAHALLNAGVFASEQGDYAAARTLLEDSLSIYTQLDAKVNMAYILTSLGNVMKGLSNYSQAAQYFQRSIALCEDIGDMGKLSYALANLGNVAIETGDYPHAHEYYEKSLRLREELKDRRGIAYSWYSLGSVDRDEGDTAQAQRRFQKSLDLFRELDYPTGIASALIGLASALPEDEENLVWMRALYEEALAIRQKLGDKLGTACALSNLGEIARKLGEYAKAHELLKESLTISWQIGSKREFIYALEYMACLVMAQGDTFSAAKLFGAAEALREATGCKLSQSEQEEYDGELKTLQSRMGEAAFTSGYAEGKRLELKEAVSFALEAKH